MTDMEISLIDSRVAIVGLGLMGGSLALALKGHCRQLLAMDTDPDIIELARKRGIVDRVSSDPVEVLPLADLIILAVPVRAILEILADLPMLQPASPVVIDLGSTKSQICQAMAALPARFQPVGGHPMCGKETGSLNNADAMIFQGAKFVLVKISNTSQPAMQLAEQLAHTIGSVPLWMDAGDHDHWVASTSHLPFLVAHCLAKITPVESAVLVGPGYRSTTRLSASPATMMRDIMQTNRENVLDALRSIQLQLRLVSDLLARGEFDNLEAEFRSTADHQRAMLWSDNHGGQV